MPPRSPEEYGPRDMVLTYLGHMLSSPVRLPAGQGQSSSTPLKCFLFDNAPSGKIALRAQSSKPNRCSRFDGMQPESNLLLRSLCPRRSWAPWWESTRATRDFALSPPIGCEFLQHFRRLCPKNQAIGGYSQSTQTMRTIATPHDTMSDIRWTRVRLNKNRLATLYSSPPGARRGERDAQPRCSEPSYDCDNRRSRCEGMHSHTKRKTSRDTQTNIFSQLRAPVTRCASATNESHLRTR